MKITIREHSQSTKASDLFLAVFSVAYFVLGLCFAQDLFACALFLLEQNKDKEKKINLSDVSISPTEFYA